jgi:predicted ATPase with chaperone activity
MNGIIANMTMIVKEFCEFRGLTSKRLFILGPPGSGKSLLAEKLSEY